MEIQEKTVLIIKDGSQIIFNGKVEIESWYGCGIRREISEAVDDILVHTLTVLYPNDERAIK